ncbi:MAG: acyl-ACP--UDP-N-acetylglucosamine O-acyltransferase [Lactobacillaceae bacterium]|jgi:UDP-N-acetylglucosamine acyltransferase|nr:acyl-ACP--UDP-N-acetylglucosamine O-acyltransferase [Lactobacillaceae bacterium]
MTNIHPTAVVEKGAKIAKSAKIGPFCVVSGKAKIGENVELISNVTIMNDTTIGDGTKVFPGAVLGAGPQDHGNEFNEGMKLIVGKNNIIRENVTMQCGTPKESMITRVGDGGMFMVNSHVAHDCVVGNHVIMTNNAVIGGHVHLSDNVIIGGNSAVHQFVHIGRAAMIGGMSAAARDVIPFGMVMNVRDGLSGLNLVGLKRRGFTKAQIAEIMSAYKLIFKNDLEGTFAERLEKAKTKFVGNEIVGEMLKFIDESLQGRRKLMTAERE